MKTALYGGDPNWGRIVQAVGAVLPGPRLTPVGVRITGVEVCRDGQEVVFDRPALDRMLAEGDAWSPARWAEAR